MLNPLPSTTIQITTPQAENGLQPGRTYSGVVRAQPDGLVALIGRVHVPLGTTSGLSAGQPILVTTRIQEGTLQLTIRAQAAAAPQSGGAEPALLESVLNALGRPELAGRLATLLPRQVPATEAALRALVSSLLAERGAGQDVQQLQQFLNSATNQGVLRADAGLNLSPWLSLTALADSAAWNELLRRARTERQAASQLARVAFGKAGPDSLQNLKQSLSSLVQRLLDDPGFQNWLRDNGQEETFRALADRVFERASGSDVQNLRALNQPYQFLEMPIPAGEGFFRLQLHFFSDGDSRKQDPADTAHRTVIDVETSRLGPVWIDLQTHRQSCSCTFKMATPELVDVVDESLPELRASLTALGYGDVRIRALPWDGDREGALLALLAPFKSLDLEA